MKRREPGLAAVFRMVSNAGAELLLRGPQTEGDLRARASRMEPLADLPALQIILEALAPRGLVQYLSPPGQKRGVYVAHGIYPPEELEKVRREIDGLERKLSNASFVERAPAEVVEENRRRLADYHGQAAKLSAALDRLS